MSDHDPSRPDEPAADSHAVASAAAAGDPGPPADARTVVVHSLLAGLTPLVPIPLLDDWILDRVRRRLVERLAAAKGDDLSAPAARPRLKLLADKDVTSWDAEGCVRGCLYKTVVFPLRFLVFRILRKLVRKIFFFLAIKDAVDEFSSTFQHAWLVRHAFAGRPVPREEEETRRLRQAIDDVRAEIDPRPLESLVRSTFRHSRRLLRRGAAILAHAARRIRRRDGEESLGWVDEAVDEADKQAGGLVDELVAGILRQEGYLQSLEARLEARLDQPTGAVER